jgi:L-asparaginase II
MQEFSPLATVTRDGIVESTHLGDLVVCDSDGRIIYALGDPGRVAYYRSSGKPLQALGIVQSGAAEQFALTDTELAVCCASHSGSRMHVLTVRGILDKLGLDHEALACGTHTPGDADEQAWLIREGEGPSPLHNNCSGKHAGMLATALALGARVEGYLLPEHPVQKLINRNLELATGLPQGGFHFGADGCGAPTVAVPLQAIATSFARLANPQDMPEDFRLAAERIMSAMAIAPDFVSAPGAFNSELLSAGEGRIAAKAGAEGLFALGARDPRHLGIAMKVADGSSRGQPPAILRVLDHYGLLSPGAQQRLERFYRPTVTNCHGQAVGAIEPVFELEG